jgi:hypothetical protein
MAKPLKYKSVATKRNTEPMKDAQLFSSSLHYLRGEKRIRTIVNGNSSVIRPNSILGKALGLTESIHMGRFKNDYD